MDMIEKTQNKTLRIINFREKEEPSDPLYTNHKTLKLQNIITLNDWLFICKLCDNFPNAFSNYFKLLKDQHRHNTRVLISSPWTYLEQILKLMGQTLVRLKQLKIGTKQSKKKKIHSDLLFKQSEYVRLVATVF